MRYSAEIAAQVVAIRVDRVSYSIAVKRIVSWAANRHSRYVCAANVHMVMESVDSTDFRNIINHADLVVPDGMPLVLMMRLKGYRHQSRVYGPTLMLHVLECAAREGIPVGFYGGTFQTLNTLSTRMQSRYSGLSIAFAYAPPFAEMSPMEEEMLVKRINRSGVKILFVGLGCPKQEVWMATHRDQISAVMLGVGAAFDFHAGVKAQAPPWMQSLGLEWLFRLLSEPRRLWKRYLYHNPRFIVLAIADLLGFLKMTA